jgi:hypothetical protein
MKMSFTTRLFVGLVAAGSVFVTVEALLQRQAIDVTRFLVILAFVLVASRFKVTLPKLNGSMSVTLPFILVALMQMSFLEALIVTCGSALMQCLGSGQKKPKPIQVLFNISNLANAIGLAYLAIHQQPVASGLPASALVVAVAATVYFLANTIPVSAIIAMTEGKNMFSIWREVFLWSFPYYVTSAGLAAMIASLHRYISWETMLLLPVAYALYISYRMYFGNARPQPAPMFTQPSRASVQTASGD